MQPQKLRPQADERGVFYEVFKVPGAGQCSFVTAKPGVVRGNHYHTRKVELFCVIEGEALIRLRDRASGEIKEFAVSGKTPQVVEMPTNWTHNIRNTGKGEMQFLIWANEVFDPSDPDTITEEV